MLYACFVLVLGTHVLKRNGGQLCLVYITVLKVAIHTATESNGTIQRKSGEKYFLISPRFFMYTNVFL